MSPARVSSPALGLLRFCAMRRAGLGCPGGLAYRRPLVLLVLLEHSGRAHTVRKGAWAAQPLARLPTSLPLVPAPPAAAKFFYFYLFFLLTLFYFTFFGIQVGLQSGAEPWGSRT